MSLINSSFRSGIQPVPSPSSDPESRVADIDAAVRASRLATRSQNSDIGKLKFLLVIPVFLLLFYSGLYLVRSYSHSEVAYLHGRPTPAETDLSTLPQLNEPSGIEIAVKSLNFDEIDAASVYAYNPVTHQVYYQSNIDEKRQIASITKLMSATIVIDQYSFNEEVVVTQEMLDSFPEPLSHVIGIKAGDKLTVEELFDSMMISSFNDAAVLLAVIHPDGYTGFVEEMNRRAELLGMSNSSFANPQGYDSQDSYSTARDVQKLVAFAMKYDRILENGYTATKTITVIKLDGTEERITLESTNKLLGKLKYMKGLKTGYTADAGPSLVGYFDAGGEDQMVTIILGGNDNRFDLTQELYYLLSESYR